MKKTNEIAKKYESNKFARWGLANSLLGIVIPFISYIGIILGAIGLYQCIKRKEKGKEMAIAAILIPIIQTIIIKTVFPFIF